MTERRNKGFGERDIRFTVSKDGRTLYAALLAWPRTAVATVAALAPHEEVRAVALLGHAAPLPLRWERTSSGALLVTMPRARPPGVRDAFVLKLSLAAPAAAPSFDGPRSGDESSPACLR